MRNLNSLRFKVGYSLKASDPGKAFLTFLARFPLCLLRYASYLHLGGACPLTGSFKDLLHLDKFLVETEGGAGGGGWAHPPALATLGKMALEVSVGFLGIGRSD